MGRSVAVVGLSVTNGHDGKGTYHVPIVSSGSSFLKVNGISVAVVGSEVADGGCDRDHVIVTGDDFADIDI